MSPRVSDFQQGDYARRATGLMKQQKRSRVLPAGEKSGGDMKGKLNYPAGRNRCLFTDFANYDDSNIQVLIASMVKMLRDERGALTMTAHDFC